MANPPHPPTTYVVCDDWMFWLFDNAHQPQARIALTSLRHQMMTIAPIKHLTFLGPRNYASTFYRFILRDFAVQTYSHMPPLLHPAVSVHPIGQPEHSIFRPENFRTIRPAWRSYSKHPQENNARMGPNGMINMNAPILTFEKSIAPLIKKNLLQQLVVIDPYGLGSVGNTPNPPPRICLLAPNITYTVNLTLIRSAILQPVSCPLHIINL